MLRFDGEVPVTELVQNDGSKDRQNEHQAIERHFEPMSLHQVTHRHPHEEDDEVAWTWIPMPKSSPSFQDQPMVPPCLEVAS